MTAAPETTDDRLLPAKGTVDLLSKSFRSVKQSERDIRKNVGKTVDIMSKLLKNLKQKKAPSKKPKVQSLDELLGEYANLGDEYAKIKSDSLSKDEKIKALAVVVRNLKKRLKHKEIEELKKFDDESMMATQQDLIRRMHSVVNYFNE